MFSTPCQWRCKPTLAQFEHQALAQFLAGRAEKEAVHLPLHDKSPFLPHMLAISTEPSVWSDRMG